MTLRRLAGVGLRRGVRVATPAGVAGASDYINEFRSLSPYVGFRADTIVLNGGKAQTLTDLSGNTRDAAQASSSLWPTVNASVAAFGNKPTLSYPSTGYHETPVYALGAFTVALVARLVTDGAIYWGHAATTPSYLDTYIFKTGGKFRGARTVSASSIKDSAAVDTTARVYVFSCGATHASNAQRWNGTDQTLTDVATGAPGAGTGTGVTRVNGWTGSGALSKISEIAELWVFPLLSGANISLVEDRLRQRYALW